MKTILKSIAALLLFNCPLLAAEPEEEKAKIVELSTNFWKAMTDSKTDEAKKSIFTKADDPELERAEFFEKMALEEFEKVVKLLKESDEVAKAKDITVRGIKDQRGREVAFVTMMVWEPKEKEYGKMSIAWLKTKKSGWRIVDL
jgi:hypothetical protein